MFYSVSQLAIWLKFAQQGQFSLVTADQGSHSMVSIGTIGPPLNFMITVEGTTIFSFSWNPPEMQDSVTITDYVIRCEPQLEGIPTPHPVTQTASLPLTAVISGLAPGVNYSCSVAAISGAREGIPAQDTASTLEIG